MFSDSFAGIAPSSVPGFVVAQLLGAAIAVAAHRLLGGDEARRLAPKPASSMIHESHR
jgi:glycerol uptake facilitator-like aquaporin